MIRPREHKTNSKKVLRMLKLLQLSGVNMKLTNYLQSLRLLRCSISVSIINQSKTRKKSRFQQSLNMKNSFL